MRPASPTPGRLRRAAGADAGPSTHRARVADALRGCAVREQLVLILLLYERLTPAEAAEVLGCTPRQVERAYRSALADLRRALRGPGRPSRAIARRSLAIEARLRKAS